MENEDFRKPIIKKNMKKNAVLNIIKQTGNIVIPLISYPYVTRTLGAESFGKYSFSNSIIQYVMLFASLGINVYAIREGAEIRDDKKEIQSFSDEIFTLNFLTMIVTLCAFLIIVAFSSTLQNYATLLLIMSLNIIGQTFSRDWLLSIYEDYTYITLRYLFFQILSLVLVFIFVHDSDDYLIYTLIMVAGTGAGYISSVIYTRRYTLLHLRFSIQAIHRFRAVLVLFASSVAVQIYINSDVTMIGLFRTQQDVGIYTLSSRIYLILKSLLNAVITVAIPRLSNLLGNNKKDEFEILFNRLKKVLEIFVFPCLVGMFVLADDVIVLIGGKEYMSGGKTLKILCVAIFFAVFGCLYSQGYLIVKKMDYIFVCATIVGAIVNIVLNMFMIPIIGINGAAITTVISEIIVFIICRLKCNIIVKNMRSTISVAISAGMLFLYCTEIQKVSISPVARVSISVIGGVALYFLLLFLLKNDIAEETANKLLHKKERKRQ